ncbi:unnamed protein product [Alopecurus aequalis]
MAKLHARLSTGRLRIYTPALYRNGPPWMEEREQDRCQLLLKIQHHYKEALQRLTGTDVERRFLDSGVCVGLLDPVSNIFVNARLAVTADMAPPPVAVDGNFLGEAERRSLDGLVTFLTCFFPYLADWEAVRYLLLAEADPLVAVRIVAEDRGSKCFRPDSAATVGALRLALRGAMVAAKHPHLADTWLSLSSSLHKANYHHNIFSTLQTLFEDTAHLPYPPPNGSSHIGPWELAASRRTYTTKVPYQHSWSLRRVLLDTIHGFYLKALARLPSRYHRSMLKAGHCYGPFDPVSNIVVNTIWYEATFPPLTRRGEKFDFVGTWSLMRIEAQSFYGLLSFMCTFHQDLSVHEAMRILLDTDVNLAATKHCSSVPEEQEAFRAAAVAAWYPYPNPDAQAGFLTSCKKPEVLSLLSNGGQQQLSSQVVQQLATLLSSGMVKQQQQPVSISKRKFSDTMAEGSQRRRAHRKICRKVKDAFKRYKKQNSEHNCYQLHVVCGVNKSVSGPDNSIKRNDSDDDDDDDDGAYYHRMHVNFLVTRNAGSVGSGPLLFFAELSNDDDGDQDRQLLCCPVDFPEPGAESVRCLFCEHEGIRIMHPGDYLEGFHGGRALEFEKMVRGEEFYDNGYYPEVYSNHRILSRSESIADWREGGLEDDSMYLGSNDFTIKEDNGDESEDYEDE